MVEDKKNRAKEMRAEGLSYQQIADSFGVVRQTVSNWLNPSGDEKRAEATRNWNAKNKDKKAKYDKERRKLNPVNAAAIYRRSYVKRKAENPVLFWANKAYHRLKNTSKQSDVPCDITVEQLSALYNATSGVCPVMGFEMKLDNATTSDNSPTVDRIIPANGYVVGNVAVISHLANRIKSNATADQVQKVADWLRIAV